MERYLAAVEAAGLAWAGRAVSAADRQLYGVPGLRGEVQTLNPKP